MFKILSALYAQEVKRAVVGYFSNNGTTAYLSFAKVSRATVSVSAANDVSLAVTFAGGHQPEGRLPILCCIGVRCDMLYGSTGHPLCRLIMFIFPVAGKKENRR